MRVPSLGLLLALATCGPDLSTGTSPSARHDVRPAALLRGRIVLPRGASTAGIEVGFADGQGAVALASDGSFELPLRDTPVGVRVAPLDVFASAVAASQDGSRWFAPFDLGQPGDEHDVDLGDVDLDAGFPLVGRVMDPDGGPVPAVRIVVVMGTTMLYALSSAEDGRFRLPGVRAAGYRVLFGEVTGGDGWDARSAELTPSAGHREPIDVTLQGGLGVVIRCHGFVGNEALRVRVHAQPIDADGTPFGWERDVEDLSRMRVRAAEDGPYDVTIEVEGCKLVTVRAVEVERQRDVVLDVPLEFDD